MAKYNDIRALADIHARDISQSPRDWTGYLDTAARLYRYDFADSLLIHAQRPDATACAELETSGGERVALWRTEDGVPVYAEIGRDGAVELIVRISRWESKE